MADTLPKLLAKIANETPPTLRSVRSKQLPCSPGPLARCSKPIQEALALWSNLWRADPCSMSWKVLSCASGKSA